MHIDAGLTRRALLISGAATAGAAALSACSGGSDGADAAASDSPTSGGATSASATPTSAATSSGASGGGAAGSNSLAALTDLQVGEPRSVDLPGGKTGLLTRTSQTAVACFSPVCTHEGCTVKPEGKKLACPCHGSVFEAATGEPTSGPAPSALAKIAVKIVDGQVVVG